MSTGFVHAAAVSFATKQFDVIVTDIALLDGTGYALVSEAKRKQNALKAIAVSGYHSAADVEIGKMWFDYHLTKPFDCHALRTILSEFSGSGTPRAGEDQTSFGSDGAAS